MPFAAATPLRLERADDEWWDLLERLLYEGKREVFTIPAGFTTDFASVPRIVTWLIPRFGRYTLAAILHDWLCVQLQRQHTAERVVRALAERGGHSAEALSQILKDRRAPATSRETDGLFRRVMREEGVPPLRRRLMWTGVRWASIFSAHRRDREIVRDLPVMLFFSLLALPVLLLGVLGISIGLVLYGALELLTTFFSREKTTTGVEVTT